MDAPNVVSFPSTGHASGFANLEEVAQKLHRTIFDAADEEIQELGNLLTAAYGLAHLMSEQAIRHGERSPELHGLSFLLSRATDWHEALVAWHERAHALATIVAKGDLDALDDFPHLKGALEGRPVEDEED